MAVSSSKVPVSGLYQQSLHSRRNHFGLFDSTYLEAFELEIGFYTSHYTNTMMVELGHTPHFASNSDVVM